MNKEKIIGFMGFDHLRAARKWPDYHQEVLFLVANRVADVWLKSEAEKEIHHLAYHDTVTDLPNRTLLEDRMRQAIKMAGRMDNHIAVIFIDLDNFKTINDTMGHENGDELLRQMAARLSSRIREYDTLARFGGDEFLIMAPTLARPEDARVVAEKIMQAFQEPLLLKNQVFHITASVGVAVYPMDGGTSEELIKYADLAMYASKEQGKNRYTLCSDDLKKEFQIHTELSNSMYRALEQEEFELYYQPKVHAMTEEILGVEALIRWNHPQFGLISPGKFIPMAEKNGLINPMGEWVLETACRQNKAWQQMGLKPIRTAVNISLGQFINKNLAGVVAGVLEKTGLDPASLELEITESIAINEPEYVVRTLNELKALGVSIAIDDFGTEYSSLSRLRTLPIDFIKLDMHFIRDITNGSKEKGILDVVLQLARTLNLRVTAEGVETGEQLAYLRQIACDEIQGFYFYRPMPKNVMEQVLKEAAAPVGRGDSRIAP